SRTLRNSSHFLLEGSSGVTREVRANVRGEWFSLSTISAVFSMRVFLELLKHAAIGGGYWSRPYPPQRAAARAVAASYASRSRHSSSLPILRRDSRIRSWLTQSLHPTSGAGNTLSHETSGSHISEEKLTARKLS